MSNRLDVCSYIPSENDKIFIDTNVWLYLFCPVGQYNQDIVDVYNRFFLRLLKNKSTIYTSSMIVSEFFNTYSRIEFNIKKNQNPNRYRNYKKDFRNTEEFEVLSKDICNLLNNKIFKYSKKLDDNFSSIDISNILLGDKNFDFNDKYFAKLCEDNNIKILTHDKDFLSLNNNIDIITT